MPLARFAQHVIDDVDVFERVLGVGAVLRGRQDDAPAGLAVDPVEFEKVVLDAHSASGFELEQVLHADARAAPRQTLEEMIAADRDVGRHQADDAGVGAADQDVLTRALDLVVLDRPPALTVPAADGTGVLPDAGDVEHAVVQHRDVGAMDGDAALREAVADDGIAGESDTPRLLVERRLCVVAVTQANEVVDRDAWSGGDAEP